MQRPLALTLYMAFATLSAPLWRLALRRRLRQGREDGARLAEKLGEPSVRRPAGRLVWFHAVSVGESLSLLTLIQRLSDSRPEMNILLTTSTLASGQALEKRALPDRVIHQYAPADYPAAVRAFLDHWRPEAAVIAEADMWPLTLDAVHKRGIPMILLNAHVTPRRFRRRSKIVASNGHLMGLFDAIYVQDAASVDLFAQLGAPRDRMRVMGVLKSASSPLPDLPDARADMAAQIAGRPCWLAAATRIEEETAVMEAHRVARALCPELLLIHAPRQTRTADQSEGYARAAFTHVARRSEGAPITPETEVYLADTIGEMGLWYRLAPVSYIGQSLPVQGVNMTGKNPFEALSLDTLVVHGTQTTNFADSYDALHEKGATLMVTDAADLGRAVVAAQDPAFRAPYLAAAKAARAANQRPLDVALGAVDALLDRAK
ncbi:3-deoxy-D-manno-octulosonic acid transferase [Roseicitreum antarcticum]|uniref:3-deoxy-D-manno-octulosonic acid transferase n=1 Tax=Roseicitreum antarcticum TaxID=564137 RepID=A0A1H2VQU8_9RHOB|nr:glycosyltransferase N-terminal domain-containing protein [Roseicitreum antarcticum]SDW70334.1 3-deoxy-D-manno-octulosonic-acid transferase [Roseicitreum antarcticum]